MTEAPLTEAEAVTYSLACSPPGTTGSVNGGIVDGIP